MAIDIMLALAVFTGFYLGFSRGIIGTVFSFLSIVFGFMFAFHFATPMTEFLRSLFKSDNPLMFAAGFALAFTLTMFIIRMFARSLEGLLKTANINIINQFLGGLVSAILMTLIYSILLWFGDQARIINDEVKRDSQTYVYLKDFPGEAKKVGMLIQPVVKDFWNKSLDMIDRLEEISIEHEEKGGVYDIPDEEPNPNE